jgi:hypothetical protein
MKWIGEPLILEDTNDPELFRVHHDFGFEDRYMNVWMAPEGSITDGASIPRFLWPIIGNPLQGPYRRAAVLHDTYYRSHAQPKEQVDLMFYNAMVYGGTSLTKAYWMWKAVCWFGGGAWEKKGKGM